MRMKSRGQRAEWKCSFNAVGHYFFHVYFMFAVRRLQQLNCLPIDCDHWFCGSSVVCGAPGRLQIDCVLQEIAGKETVTGWHARRGFKVSGFQRNNICQWQEASSLNKSNISKIWTKFNCHLQVFPLVPLVLGAPPVTLVKSRPARFLGISLLFFVLQLLVFKNSCYHFFFDCL